MPKYVYVHIFEDKYVQAMLGHPDRKSQIHKTREISNQTVILRLCFEDVEEPLNRCMCKQNVCV